MVFSSSGLLVSSSSWNKTQNLPTRKGLKGRKKKTKEISACLGSALNIHDRVATHIPNPYNFACSLRCRHPIHNLKERSITSLGKSDEWTSENIYKKYTETDSRPTTPDVPRLQRTAATIIPTVVVENRKCITPEPETKQCQFHQRRVLILDLRRVKSVDALIRQDSVTTGTSVDSTYEDDDGDKSSSTPNADSLSIFHHLSSRNLSLSRSTTPKTRLQVRRLKKTKERSSSPIVYERSTSPKILEGLILPPLHSSVLTLLGQRSPTKASPRTGLSQGNQPQSSTTTSKHKKLRRHGRRKKSPSLAKETIPSGNNEDQLKSGDDASATQLSSRTFGDDVDNAEASGKLNTRNLAPNTKSLLQVVNENLAKTSKGYYKDIVSLEKEIAGMNEKYLKKNVVLNSAKIGMKEDTWLALPRTSSHTSATFGAPGDSRQLQSLHPLQYLQKFVTISDARKQLYSLVFRRYRTLENPTGTTIKTQVVQRALSEVIGQTLNQETVHDIFSCLMIDSKDAEVNESEFYGISAFCERIYARYSMENCNECYTCSKYAGKDKNRCHQNQKSLIEQADFEYLSSKLRDNAIGPNLRSLIQSLCNTPQMTC